MSKFSAVKAVLVPPWWPRYRKDYIRHDVIAGLIVALMLIPQGLAYATLAGVGDAVERQRRECAGRQQ